ncbi:MAG: radical SAM protein [Pseudomonadota bacterium]
MILFKDGPSAELAAHFADVGLDPARARRLQAAVVKTRTATVPARLDGLRKELLAAIAARSRVPALTILERETSATDGFTRYLFRGEGPELFEAVRIPLVHRPGKERCIVCVSSQAGCAMGCTFCATGRLGWQRDLHTWEMVDQILAVAEDQPWPPVRGVVFMGMGEALANYERVLRAVAVLNEPCGPALDARGMTISTAGHVPGILRLAQDDPGCRLIASLVAADDEKRRALMPVARRWPLGELMAALRTWQAATHRRVLLAWVMMSGVNLGEEDAIALGRLTEGLPCQIDLIPVHDTSGTYQPPGAEEQRAFLDALRAHVPQPVAFRYSGGADVGASCGALAGKRRAP